MLPPRSSILYSCTPFARHAALATESENAFTACDRNQTHLLHVRSRALQKPFSAYPSPALLKDFVAKAWADRARATVATPWPNKTGYTRLHSQPNSPPTVGKQAISADDSSADFSLPCRPTRPLLPLPAARRPSATDVPPPARPTTNPGSVAFMKSSQTRTSPCAQLLICRHIPPPPPSPSRVSWDRPQPGASPCSHWSSR